MNLRIVNFGVFKGTNTFDLANKNKPIILFGGRNGAGKTTLLEAIRLCLYGSRALGRISQKDYQEYIAKRFHRPPKEDYVAKSAEVSLTFEYAHFGRTHNYAITRKWSLDGYLAKEKLAIKSDDDVLNDLSVDGWNDFIQDILPIGVAELFFFDGEKIQDLADDNLSETTLADAMKQMLNLNVIEQLQVDLKEHERKIRKKLGKGGTDHIAKLANERNNIQEHIQQNREAHAEHLSKHAGIIQELQKLESRLRRVSGGLATKRESLREEKAHLEGQLEAIDNQIEDLAKGLLPFALIPELTNDLVEQLNQEAAHQQWRTAKNIVAPKIKNFIGTLEHHSFWEGLDLDSKSQEALKTKISASVNSLIAPPKEADLKVVHDIANNEKQQLLSWISQINDVTANIDQHYKAMEQYTRRHRKICRDLDKVPDDDTISPILRQITEHQKQLGLLTAAQAQTEREYSSLKQQLSTLMSEYNREEKKLREKEGLVRQEVLLERVKGALHEFNQELTKRRVEDLEKILLQCFNALARKESLVSKIEIDPETFSVALYTPNGKNLHRDRLSAGEKQIFAVSILWALRQLSGRPLPVLIDTPLGRLDTEHRDKLVHQYFPRISHQVILFSTDTEVDQNYLANMMPHTSRSYHLAYDNDTGSTRVEDGYFWGLTHATQ